eukprot:TRINITY_DN25917_c0_g1_i1.p1 TRINITY_DN25917_c0_g1~~TRINITY_DN25917_c0_g1_i1.p1  ORF type:complete len:507 (+),score=117.93 TRINITY_DN25917_c0_g1_i1:82-1521(+)
MPPGLRVLNERFSIEHYDGGEPDPRFPPQAILQLGEDSFHCSGSGVGHNLVLAAAGGAAQLTHVVVRSPARGCSEPLRTGLIWAVGPEVGGEALLAAMRAHEGEDTEAAVAAGRAAGALPPAAAFEVDWESFEVVACLGAAPVSAARVGVKFIDTFGDDENIDVAYVALVGPEADLDAAVDPSEPLPEGLGVTRPAVRPALESFARHAHLVGKRPCLVVVGDDPHALRAAGEVAPAMPRLPDGTRMPFLHAAAGTRDAAVVARAFEMDAGESAVVITAAEGAAQCRLQVPEEALIDAEAVRSFVTAYLRGALVPGHEHAHSHSHADGCGHGHSHGHGGGCCGSESDDGSEEACRPCAATCPEGWVRIVSPEALAAALRAGRPTVVVATSSWCGAWRRSPLALAAAATDCPAVQWLAADAGVAPDLLAATGAPSAADLPWIRPALAPGAWAAAGSRAAGGRGVVEEAALRAAAASALGAG